MDTPRARDKRDEDNWKIFFLNEKFVVTPH